MRVPSPSVVLPFLAGALVTGLLHPGGEASSFRGASWVLLQLGLVAVPLTAGLNMLSREPEKDVRPALSAWAGAVLSLFYMG